MSRRTRAEIIEQLEALFVTGLDVVWAGSFPIIGLQAMWATGRKNAVDGIAKLVSPLEDEARFAWRHREDVPAGFASAQLESEDDPAILGFVAAGQGVDAVERVVATLAASAHSADLVGPALYAAAALRTDPVPAPWRALLAPDEAPLEFLIEDACADAIEPFYEMGWRGFVEAAVLAPDRRGLLEQLCGALLHVAGVAAAQYLERVHTPRFRRTVETSVEAVAKTLRAGKPHGRMRIGRACTELAERGAMDALASVVATVTDAWGPIARWDRTIAFEILCALGRWQEAIEIAEMPTLSCDIHLLGCLARGGHEPELVTALEEFFTHEPEPVSRVLLPRGHLSDAHRDRVHDRALRPGELLRLAPALFRLDPGAEQRLDARITARIAALPTTLAELDAQVERGTLRG